MPELPRRAVIDLGTNTFHLLIAELTEAGALREVYRERIYVKLASEGIETIGTAPFNRGLEALRHFRTVIDQHEVADVTAIGTAALRTATNGEIFVSRAKLEAGVRISLITGDREAEYITRGVLAALPPLNDRILIMDIGGGSTEYIIASGKGVHWRQSFPVGVAILQRAFHHADPISRPEIRKLNQFLDEQLSPLKSALLTFPLQHLVGAAGTFDVLAEVVRDDAIEPLHHSHSLNLAGLKDICLRLVASTTKDRLDMEGIPSERADLIVVAMLLIDYTLKIAGIKKITVSDYAMKEGILLY